MGRFLVRQDGQSGVAFSRVTEIGEPLAREAMVRELRRRGRLTSIGVYLYFYITAHMDTFSNPPSSRQREPSRAFGFTSSKKSKLEGNEEKITDIERIELGLLERRDELLERFNQKERRGFVRALVKQRQAEALPGSLAAVCKQYGPLPEGMSMPMDALNYESLTREDHVNYRLAALLSEIQVLAKVLENIEGGRSVAMMH